jgi:hypothetical protein
VFSPSEVACAKKRERLAGQENETGTQLENETGTQLVFDTSRVPVWGVIEGGWSRRRFHPAYNARHPMASDRTIRRRRLFKLYAANFAIYNRDHPGLCPCPICLMGYSDAGVEAETLAMDIAHVYPEACGGGPETLTCKSCNSKLGAQCDSHIVQDYKIIDALSGTGNGRLPARVYFPRASIGATFRRTGDRYHLDEVPRQTNPADTQKILEQLKGGGTTTPPVVQFKTPDPARFAVAILHSAYLSIYRYFGSEYLVFAETAWARELLIRVGNGDEPDEHEVFYVPVMEIPLTNPPSPLAGAHFTPVVCKVRTLGGIFCIGVPLPSPNPATAGTLVMMPGFGPGAMEAYDKLRMNWRGMQHRVKIAAENIAPEERLQDPEYGEYGRWWWQHLTQKLHA